MRPAVLLSFAMVLGCTEPVGRVGEAVVYGEDGRTEVFAHPSAALRAVAESSIVMKIDEDNLDETDPADVRVTYTRTLGEAKSLCAGERFADQIEPGTCSGTLIDERHILTAGHCMDAPSDCTGSVWLFGFRYTADGVLSTHTSDDVYRCAQVLAYFDDGRVDHAVVRLDRPVVGHAPATVVVHPAGLAPGTGLALIGHPNGLPMKIDSGGEATVTSGDALSLRATVDAFNGNSGSGVFDLEGALVALLRGGETDYVDEGGCNVVNVIDPPPTDDGESLVYMRPIVEAFCATPGVISPLCECDGPCVPALAGDLCDDAEPLEARSQTVRGELTGYTPWTTGSCGGDGAERVFSFTVDAATHFRAVSTGFDTVLYLRDACEGDELACHDDVDRDTNRGSILDLELAPGGYVLFLDSYGPRVGAFTLTLTFEDPVVPDAGPPVTDAAPPTPDAGPPPADAGSMHEPTGGCSCRAGPPLGGARLLGLVAGAFGLSVLRRRATRARR